VTGFNPGCYRVLSAAGYRGHRGSRL